MTPKINKFDLLWFFWDSRGLWMKRIFDVTIHVKHERAKFIMRMEESRKK
jgi:hypothetical protein